MKLELKQAGLLLAYQYKLYGASDIWTIQGITIDNEFLVFNGISKMKVGFDQVGSEFSILARPLSDLIKQINHNGEKFTPVKKLDSDYSVILADDGGIYIGSDTTGYGANFHEYMMLFEWHFDVFSKGLSIDINKFSV